MARLFDDGASDKLVNASASWSLPISIAAWFRFDVEPGNMVIAAIGEKADTGYISLRTTATGDALRADAFDGAAFGASQHGTDMAANVWYHGLAVFASTTSRTVYLDGDAAAENTTDITVSPLDNNTIGVSADVSPFGYYSGEAAEVAIWDTAVLTVADALMLAKGYSPLFVKPQNLKVYWPLIRGLNDRIGGFNLTATGTAITAHPRIIYPSEILVPVGTAAAPVGNAGIMTPNTGYWGPTF